MSLITIEQLLESVDLDFEPGWITQDADSSIWMWREKPRTYQKKLIWNSLDENREPQGINISNNIKLAEFDGKNWTDCIYEVPRKTDEYEQTLEKLGIINSDLVYRVNLPRKTTGKIEKVEGYTTDKILAKVNELIDAVNELKENKGV